MSHQPPSGGGRYQLDVSWRKGRAPIEVLVNPWGPEAPRMIEALTLVPLANGKERGRRSVRFQLNALGVVWFGCAYTIMHGDESRGRLISQPHDRDEWRKGLLGSPALVYGSIIFPEWRLEANDVGIDLAHVYAARDMLGLFQAWRRAVTGTRLQTWA